mmetsp:Transcript_74916/g.219474  ORF Transcript_74916/g.219474 Transcript_74916/m.219474 type:complete len:233 (+) Transcript_74916:568-1266(+)
MGTVLAAPLPDASAPLQVPLHGLPVGGGHLPAPGCIELLHRPYRVLYEGPVAHVDEGVIVSTRCPEASALQGLCGLGEGAGEVLQHAVPHLCKVCRLVREDLLLTAPQGTQGPDNLLRRPVRPDELRLREGLLQGPQKLEVQQLALEHVALVATPAPDLRLLQEEAIPGVCILGDLRARGVAAEQGRASSVVGVQREATLQREEALLGGACVEIVVVQPLWHEEGEDAQQEG